MEKVKMLFCFTVLLSLLAASGNAIAEEGKKLSIDSLIGKYDGTMEIHMIRTLEYSYQAEITPVADDANLVSLTAHCSKCETPDWKRNNCKITEIKEVIKFTCKGKSADEEYVFNGDRLKTSGFGSKFPYSVSAKKIEK